MRSWDLRVRQIRLNIRRTYWNSHVLRRLGTMLLAGHRKKGGLAMAIPTRAPIVHYLLANATLLRRSGNPQAVAERLDQHACALQLLAEYVRVLSEDDERLLLLGTLTVRGGEFAPGPATAHALSHFTGRSVEECNAFFAQVSHTALDDALARARHAHFGPTRASNAQSPAERWHGMEDMSTAAHLSGSSAAKASRGQR